MSAREWFKCPFCKKETDKAKEEYGKIPLEKFLTKYKESLITEWDTDGEEPNDVETVRMDGEEYLDDDGTYKIQHSLFCNNCGRNWNIDVLVKATESEKDSKLTFKVPSKSGGEDHEVEVFNGEYKCDCVSFKTRKTCSHIDKIKIQLVVKQ
jgi:hypothetical protein